jgi:serine/threonine protein phosphatase PrpC
VRSAQLLGRQHPSLDTIAAIGEGPAAICLSRGGAYKTYRHTDPNEDAACFAIGPGGTLAAVADGHHGAHGAARAIEWLLEGPADAWTAEQPPIAGAEAWQEQMIEALQQIHRAVLVQAESLHTAPAPTTLSMAVVRPLENLVLHASVGDSLLFLASSAAARDVGWASQPRRRCGWLGEKHPRRDLEESQWIVGSESLRGIDAVLVASDGLSETNIGVDDPAAAAATAVAHGSGIEPDRRPLETCKHLTATALQAHRDNNAGDNISAAVVWTGR